MPAERRITTTILGGAFFPSRHFGPNCPNQPGLLMNGTHVAEDILGSANPKRSVAPRQLSPDLFTSRCLVGARLRRTRARVG